MTAARTWIFKYACDGGRGEKGSLAAIELLKARVDDRVNPKNGFMLVDKRANIQMTGLY